MEGLATVVRVFLAAPLLWLGLASWGAARWAKRQRLQWWWVGLPVAAVWLYKNRRDLRGLIVWSSGVVAGLVWLLLLWSSPGLRFAVGVAIPTGLAVLAIVWLASNYPTLPIHEAVQFAIAERRSREVVTDAVAASVGEGAKVLSVRPLEGGQFEAVIGGPPGMSHGDLLESLRDTLAESIRATSGRVVTNVAVSGPGAKGTALVRCSTFSPYSATVRLEDL
jgi:hypothetical protein